METERKEREREKEISWLKWELLKTHVWEEKGQTQYRAAKMELELKSTISSLRARSYPLQQGSDNYKRLRRGWESRRDNVVLRGEDWTPWIRCKRSKRATHWHEGAVNEKPDSCGVFSFSLILIVIITEFPRLVFARHPPQRPNCQESRKLKIL